MFSFPISSVILLEAVVYLLCLGVFPPLHLHKNKTGPKLGLNFYFKLACTFKK